MIRLILSSLRSHAKGMVSAVVVLSLSLFLVMQQMSTFQKVVHYTYGMAAEMQGVDLWVMAPSAGVMKIKNLEGVAACAPFYRGVSFINGKKWTIIGVDEGSLLGLPQKLAVGNVQHLALEGAVFVDSKYSKLKVGHVLPIGKGKAVVVGLYHSSKEPIIYTTLERARQMAQVENADLSFILVKAKEGADLSLLCQRIKKATGFQTFTKGNFFKMVRETYLKTSGFPSHFAWAIFLGFFLALGIMCMTLISVCEKLKRNLALFHLIGAPMSTLAIIGLVHCVGVCLLSFAVSFLCSLLFAFSWKVVGVALMAILLMGSIIPILFVRSYDRLHSAL